MKKLLTLALSAALVLSLAACSSGDSEKAVESNNIDSNGNVRITLPDCPYEDEEEIRMLSEEKGWGWTDITFNDDGSMSFTVEKEDREAYLEKRMTALTDELLDAAQSCAEEKGEKLDTSIDRRVEYSYQDGTSVFNFYTDRRSGREFSGRTFTCSYLERFQFYQAYSGYDYNSDIIFNVIDVKADEIIESISLSSLLEERKDQQAEQEYEKNLSNMMPQIGMTADQVRRSAWGSPDKINKDTYSWGVKEQWVYNDYGYVYLENGIVTSISER